MCIVPVSYTHLDVYKRQEYRDATKNRESNRNKTIDQGKVDKFQDLYTQALKARSVMRTVEDVDEL